MYLISGIRVRGTVGVPGDDGGLKMPLVVRPGPYACSSRFPTCSSDAKCLFQQFKIFERICVKAYTHISLLC